MRDLMKHYSSYRSVQIRKLLISFFFPKQYTYNMCKLRELSNSLIQFAGNRIRAKEGPSGPPEKVNGFLFEFGSKFAFFNVIRKSTSVNGQKDPFSIHSAGFFCLRVL